MVSLSTLRAVFPFGATEYSELIAINIDPAALFDLVVDPMLEILCVPTLA
jgi:hypothetical protein